MLGLAHGLALGRAEMRAQTPPDGFGNHPSFILVLLLRPGAKSLYSGPDSGPGSWLVAAQCAGSSGSGRPRRSAAGPGALPKAARLEFLKHVSVKRSYGVCDWGRTHITVEREHKEWRDHRTFDWQSLSAQRSPLSPALFLSQTVHCH